MVPRLGAPVLLWLAPLAAAAELPAAAGCGEGGGTHPSEDSSPVPPGLLAAVRRRGEQLSPRFWFERRQAVWPCGADWYLQRAELRWRADSVSDVLQRNETTVVPLGQLTTAELLDTAHVREGWRADASRGRIWTAGCTHGLIPQDEPPYLPTERAALQNWALQPGADDAIKAGDRDNAPVYVRHHVTRDLSGVTVVDITYVLMFAYQPGRRVGNLAVGEHYADIEHVTARLSLPDLGLRNVFWSAHGEGTWRHGADVELEDGHIVTYVDADMHALYPAAGSFEPTTIPGIPEIFWDKTERGIKWAPSRLVEIPPISEHMNVALDSPIAWVRYRGRWGPWTVGSIYIQDWIAAECSKRRNAQASKFGVYQCDPTNSSAVAGSPASYDVAPATWEALLQPPIQIDSPEPAAAARAAAPAAAAAAVCAAGLLAAAAG